MVKTKITSPVVVHGGDDDSFISKIKKNPWKIALSILIIVVIVVLTFVLIKKDDKKENYLLEQPRSDPQSKEDIDWSVPKEIDRILRRQQQNLKELVRE